ncbi:MAG: molybdopterin molybdotransferase MoeA [Bacteroidota bacterium]
MISVQEALTIILEHRKDFAVEQVPLDQAIGRLLREDLLADRDFPPYNRVTMDGIAIRYEDFERGQRHFAVQGTVAAGMPQQTLQAADHCLEIMTGAILPEQADTIIRYEDVEIKNGAARITIDTVKARQNVHRKGSDREQGARVVEAGMLLSPAEVGVAATIGKAQLAVSQLPSCLIISTGDELVGIDQQPLPHQIRRSNVHRLQATLAKHHILADTAHLMDDLEEVTRRLEGFLGQYEVIILSGGVSKGKFDYIPEALARLGVEKCFHRVAQRPGKPFWFGQAPNGTVVFALPGNPVSSFMCMQAYFLPWLRASLGLAPTPYPKALLKTPVTFRPDLVYFLQVAIEYDQEGRIWARPVEGRGSGDLANLADADAFLQLPQGRTAFNAGEVFPLIVYR